MVTNIKEQILSKLPAKQSELSKALNINKRVISKVAIEMVNSGLISRKKINQNGITTYLIQKNVTRNMTDTFKLSQLNPKYKALSSDSNKENKYKALLNEKGMFSPCTGCMDFCEPIICQRLVDFL